MTVEAEKHAEGFVVANFVHLIHAAVAFHATEAARLQEVNGKKFVHDWKVESLQNCSACHR